MLDFVKRNLNIGSRHREETNPCVATCCGFILIIVGLILLGYFEYNYVVDLKNISDLEDSVIELTPSQLYDAGSTHDGEYIQFYGTLDVNTTLASFTDTKTTLHAANSIVAMKRSTMILNYEESKGNCLRYDSKNHCQEYSYNYNLDWTSTAISSSSFHNPSYHNTGFSSKAPELCTQTSTCSDEWFAPDGSSFVGKFDINYNLLSKYTSENSGVYSTMTSNSFTNWGSFQSLYQSKGWTIDNYQNIIKGNTYTQGSVKVSYYEAPSGSIVSILAKQSSQRTSPGGRVKLEPIELRGKTYFRIESGMHTKSDMMTDLESEADTTVWVMRFVTFFMLFLGIRSLFSIIDFLLDYMPHCFCGIMSCLGEIAPCILWIVSFCSAVCIWLTVWAICWVIFRPIYLAIILPLVIIAVGISVWYGRKRKALKAKQLENTANTQTFQQVQNPVPVAQQVPVPPQPQPMYTAPQQVYAPQPAYAPPMQQQQPQMQQVQPAYAPPMQQPKPQQQFYSAQPTYGAPEYAQQPMYPHLNNNQGSQPYQ